MVMRVPLGSSSENRRMPHGLSSSGSTIVMPSRTDCVQLGDTVGIADIEEEAWWQWHAVAVDGDLCMTVGRRAEHHHLALLHADLEAEHVGVEGTAGFEIV